jgi:hypothetical protein
MTEAEPLLVDTGRGYTVRYRGKALYSSRDPLGAALRRVEQLEIRPKTLVLVPSIGLGYGLRELLAKLPDSCHVLCIEADEHLFRLAMDHASHLPTSPELSVLRTEQPREAARAVQRLGPWRFRRVLPVHLCGGYQIHRRTYTQILEAVEEEIRLFWQNKLTLMAMGRLWLKNLFTNLRFLPGSGSIEDLATDRPILVCGAGPSLEGCLDWIRRARSRVILLSVDTALPVLAASGILPDWVFSLDAQLYTLQDFLPFRNPRILLLCDLTSNPQSLRLFSDIFFFSTRFHPLSLFERLEAASVLPISLPPRGSVGVSAVEAALSITTGPVLFTGLDFSYPRHQTHARGAPFHLRMLQSCNRIEPCGMSTFTTLLARPRLLLRDKVDNPLVTDLVLHSYAGQMRKVAADSRRTFDLSSEGLPVGGRRVNSLEELLRLFHENPGSAPEVRLLPGRIDAGAVRRFCEQELRLLSDVLRSIGESDPDLREALSPAEYLLLPLPEVDPDRILKPETFARLAAEARLMSLYLERTLLAL